MPEDVAFILSKSGVETFARRQSYERGKNGQTRQTNFRLYIVDYSGLALSLALSREITFLNT